MTALDVGDVPLIHHDVVTSTQDVARALARGGAAPFTAVLADRQTSGRGRSGAVWESRPGLGLYLSVLLPPSAAASGLVSLACGLALRQALIHTCHFPTPPHLKWPNDLVTARWRKLAGLLLEVESGVVSTAVLGVGVNLRHRLDDFDPEVRSRATSVALECGSSPEPAELARAVVACLASCLDQAELEPARAVGDWRRASLLEPGQQLRMVEAGRELVGTFRGIADDGALLLDEDGTPRRLYSGDVRGLAPRTGGETG